MLEIKGFKYPSQMNHSSIFLAYSTVVDDIVPWFDKLPMAVRVPSLIKYELVTVPL